MIGTIISFVILVPGLYLVILVGKFLNKDCGRCGKKFWTWNLFQNHCSTCQKVSKAQDYMAGDYLKEREKKENKKEEKFTCVKCEIVYKEEYLGGENKEGKVCKYCLEDIKKEKSKKE
ncbi:MAG: hypothetical protein I3270_01325 [Candidatus Moeniiplasma glomeromycotorum]|nr:hypothetical protein [Candidatus Moeniiplasma glomeromycotorum]MCE8162350.1 hypothetical protein [Candidatus Moeniiplasma glomeromycotorum]MCE8166274.1 hypothetical protein [Candidatus Moeniiplasma glomeromycotorum]MCE8166756.1 hypothetical protein [Candidatus Moeniiplasma glomeromycotorum]